MMWHWNSLWEPAPGNPPAALDPGIWKTPWSAEQAIALQARSWEAMLSAAHSWWTLALSAWPMPANFQVPGWTLPSADPAATTGIEPLAVKPAAPRKRSSATRTRRTASTPARKR